MQAATICLMLQLQVLFNRKDSFISPSIQAQLSSILVTVYLLIYSLSLVGRVYFKANPDLFLFDLMVMHWMSVPELQVRNNQ